MSKSCSFSIGPDGLYRCDAFEHFIWQTHGFGTRWASPEATVTLRQIHSNRVVNAAGLKDRAKEGDALVTDQVGILAGVRTADCVPILLLDSETKAVAAIHAGWRGTATRIVAKTVEQMCLEFSSKPEDLRAAIGPCIRACCYKIGPDVAGQFRLFFPEWGDTLPNTLDLAETNRRQMQTAGLLEEHIFDCDLCTTCLSADFFSYRREPGNNGRMTAAIGRLA